MHLRLQNLARVHLPLALQQNQEMQRVELRFRSHILPLPGAAAFGRSSCRSFPGGQKRGHSRQQLAAKTANVRTACILGQMARRVLRTHVAISVQMASPESSTGLCSCTCSFAVHLEASIHAALRTQPSSTQLSSTVRNDRLLPVAPSSVSSLLNGPFTFCLRLQYQGPSAKVPNLASTVSLRN